jgi:hypothetical protein
MDFIMYKLMIYSKILSKLYTVSLFQKKALFIIGTEVLIFMKETQKHFDIMN